MIPTSEYESIICKTTEYLVSVYLININNNNDGNNEKALMIRLLFDSFYKNINNFSHVEKERKEEEKAIIQTA